MFYCQTPVAIGYMELQVKVGLVEVILTCSF